MKKIVSAGFGAVALLVTTAGCSQASEESNSDGLTGEWRMTSLEVGTEGNMATVEYSGQVIFTDDTMSVQAMNPDTSAPDTPLTVQGYEAYYGDLTRDPDAGTLSVTVESAAARDLIGQTFDRNYEVDGDTLVLTPSDPAEGFRVTYERHSPS
ncbi:lipocalin-like domain-containing protein [Rhodococcus sp. 114MFTsu3.1]|uniref:lipocalin-like domain-containing protein n=1 Tax=Rhodococcus sp. 114MFTsu3.1 TaxID=1172184 RepID=UPI00035E17F8|nr:lipocalin-like domain-containing protein [Rhodococcus sp. 114MFTsu3.1]